MAATGRGHPREWVAAACDLHGVEPVLEWCAQLLEGSDAGQIGLDCIGGPGAADMVHRSGADYFPRVWAARAMRYAWIEDPPGAVGVGRRAERALTAGLADEHWRVREMCAKVIAVHEVGMAADALASLLADDAVPRVRAAALAALGAVGEHEHLAAVASAAGNPDLAVARAAERAITRLRTRLDLPD